MEGAAGDCSNSQQGSPESVSAYRMNDCEPTLTAERGAKAIKTNVNNFGKVIHISKVIHIPKKDFFLLQQLEFPPLLVPLLPDSFLRFSTLGLQKTIRGLQKKQAKTYLIALSKLQDYKCQLRLFQA